MRTSPLSLLPFILALAALLLPMMSASLHEDGDLQLPPGLRQIDAYNESLAAQYLSTATIFIAFLAGILTLLSPCILPLLPAFFSYTFASRRRITLMTLLFLAGFALAFTLIVLAAVWVGISSAIMLQLSSLGLYVRVTGALLILVALLGLLGIALPGIAVRKETPTTGWGIFLYGILFALGWTVCVGPILSGVVLMASVYANYAQAALLILAYSVGIFLPLLLLSVAYDKLHLERLTWIRGRELSYRLFGSERKVHTSTLIASILFLLLGLAFFLTGGTALVNTWDPFGTKLLFYEWQPVLLENAATFNIIGGLALLSLLLLVLWGLKRKETRRRGRRSSGMGQEEKRAEARHD